MATAFVNPQQPRIDAWIQPGCRADIAVVSTESWPVDTVVTIGVADAAGVIAVPLLTITPDLATVTATVALTGVQVAALAVACPPPYGVIDWQWRTGAGSPLGVGSLHWDLTGARTTQTVTVMMGPAGPGATPEAISALVEDYLVAHPPTGSGDVTGPASAIAGNLPVLDVTGKVLSDSGYDPTDFASAGHNHAGVYDAAGTAAGLVGAITPGSIGAAPALSPDDNYVTDAEKAALHGHANAVALAAVSGTNTGDQTLPTWGTLSGKPAVVAEGATAAAARTAIGAGTSSLVLGTTAGTAAAGNDSRLSDARTPTAHDHDDRYYTEAETDARIAAVTPASIGAATSAQGAKADSASQPGHTHTLDATTDTATRVAMTPAERTKLAQQSGTNTGDQTLPTWGTIAGKPAVVAAGADAAAARTAIGAGTSSLVIGTGAGDAKAGNYAPDLSGYVPTSRTVAGKALTGNITLTASDVGALASETLPATIVDAKGDLLIGSAADTLTRLAIGTDGQVLTADSGQASGVKWASAGDGGARVYRAPANRWTAAPSNGPVDQGITSMPPNQLHSVWFPLDHHATITKIGAGKGGGGAGMMLRAGIYGDTGRGLPGDLLLDAGALPADGSGSLHWTGLALDLSPGLYWIVAVAQGLASSYGMLAFGVVNGGFGAIHPIVSGGEVWAEAQTPAGAPGWSSASTTHTGPLPESFGAVVAPAMQYTRVPRMSLWAT